MHDNCNDCPVNARVDSLVKEFDRYRDGSGKTHKEMFERLSALEQARASMKTILESMDTKLDKLVSWREELDDKASLTRCFPCVPAASVVGSVVRNASRP